MAKAEITSRFADVGELRLHYHEAGDGPALIYLHGGGPGSSGLSNFSRNIDPFSGRYRVIALDLPGYGQSSKPPIEGSIWRFYAAAIAGFIDALGLAKAHLVGNSLGGGVALRTALDYPEKVDRLVLMGPAGGYSTLAPSPTEGIMALLTFYDAPAPTPEKLRNFLRYLVYDTGSISDELLNARFAQAMEPETARNMPLRLGPGSPIHATEDLWRERLDWLPHETLIVWGREDRVNTLEGGMILMRQIPNARLLVFPKCGHWAQWEKADEFNRVLGDFLSA